MRARFLSSALVLLASATLGFAFASTAWAATDEEKCINALNKDFWKASSAQAKENASCLRDAQTGKLGTTTAQDCLELDRRGKVDKAVVKAFVDDLNRCGVPPSFGPLDGQSGAERAVAKELATIASLFGGDLDAALLPGKDAQNCQFKTLKMINKCSDTRLKEFVLCKKLGIAGGAITDAQSLQDQCLGTGAGQPDPKGKIAKACDLLSEVSPGKFKVDKIRKMISKCEGDAVALDQAIPGCATTDASALHGCINASLSCELCRFLNEADDLALDCDQFDDGALNASCDAVCGDGLADVGEACDDGNATSGDGCRADCTIEACGDGIVDVGEACDDGATVDGDGCSASCAVEAGYACAGEPSSCDGLCGDGAILGTEVCDDGGTASGDGCDASCDVETGFACAGEPSSCDGICGDGVILGTEACDDGGITPGDGCDASCGVEAGFTCASEPSSCSGICGDGLVRGTEACDDGATTPGDGCNAFCLVELGHGCGGEPSACDGICGDGLLFGSETCDDANAAPGDGCDGSCQTETGFACVGVPSACTGVCGDGLVRGAETCDDGGVAPGDGCNASCAVEPGHACVGEPSVCQGDCGNGILDAGEACDDGNPTNGDGCTDTCVVESGYGCGGAPSVCNTVCGDGLIVGTEVCDDGGTAPGDGCDGSCALESGYVCGGEPSSCATVCGDGLVRGSEGCDDGGTVPGDGCDGSCAVESGYGCAGEPSSCNLLCGDGTTDAGEECDDGAGNSSAPDANCRLDCTLGGCGDDIADTGEECDDGALNSDAPDASCRLDCSFPSCGDGIIDPLAGEACEVDGDCAVGEVCGDCECGEPLGSWFFNVAAGSSANCPADGDPGSFLKGRGLPTGGLLGTICSLTRGNFGASANFELVGGVPDASGVAEVELAAAQVVAVQQPSIASDNWICVRVESNGPGWVDCDGGMNADSTAVVDSNGAAAPPAPEWDDLWFTTPSGVTDSGVGAATIPVSVKLIQGPGSCPGPADAAWAAENAINTALVTGTATSTITDAQSCPGGNFVTGTCPSSPFVTSLSGTNLSCATWTTQTNKSMVVPLFFLGQDFGEAVGETLGVGDIAIAARITTDP